MWSIRPVLKDDERRMIPWTSYPFSIRNSARYEPSCPVMPVMSARLVVAIVVRYFGGLRGGGERIRSKAG
jgi:hypothetical protein